MFNDYLFAIIPFGMSYERINTISNILDWTMLLNCFSFLICILIYNNIRILLYLECLEFYNNIFLSNQLSQDAIVI